MRTLEQIKKEKNFKANIKGYPIDPEGFPKWFLLKRLNDEYIELKEIFYIENNNQTEEYLDDLVMDELADMSNIIDFLATKIVVNYPDRYDPEQVEG
jgi:hypothetical protein